MVVAIEICMKSLNCSYLQVLRVADGAWFPHKSMWPALIEKASLHKPYDEIFFFKSQNSLFTTMYIRKRRAKEKPNKSEPLDNTKGRNAILNNFLVKSPYHN